MKKMLLLICAVIMFSTYDTSITRAEETDFLSQTMIAHAMGEIGGHIETNSYDAWAYNYKKGFRFFETDLLLTSDGELVARHDWLPYLYEKLEQSVPLEDIPSYQTFMQTKINKNYAPLDFRSIAQIMKDHPDMYLDIDTKELDPQIIKKQFSKIKEIANEIDPEILDRIIPEIYTPQMYKIVMRIIPFKNVMYSIYMINDDDDTVISFMNQHNIHVLSTDSARLTDEFLEKLKENNIITYAFTVNSEKEAKTLKQEGVYGFYTDALASDILIGKEKKGIFQLFARLYAEVSAIFA